jgi:Trypsin-like peptidase domain/TPR repeat/Tetratricopeptide repeat
MRRKNGAYFFITLFSFFLISYIGLSLAQASDGPSPYKESVVSITVSDNRGKEVGRGTGFVVEQDGTIATTCSVLSLWYEDIENTMTVTMQNKNLFPVDDVLYYDCRKNVALIKIDTRGLPSLKLTTGHKFKKGENIIILSSPTAGSGKIHAKIKSVSVGFSEPNVSITPETSGSPVLTEKGAVIGIATFLLEKRKKVSGVVAASEIEDQLARYKKYVKKFHPTQIRPSRSQPPARKIESERSNIQKAERLDDFMNYYLIGCDQERRQMYASAIESFKEVIAVKPDYGAAYSNLGNVYYKIGRYDDAADSYRQAVRISPGVPSLYTKLGTVLIILGEYKRAIEAFDKVVKLDPNNAEAYFNLGIAYLLNGDRSAVRNVQKTLRELDKNRAQSLLELLD